MAKQADLLSVEEAQQRILARFSRLPDEPVRIEEAQNRVLAQDMSSPISVPPFANSSMDGFALRARDVAQAQESNPSILSVALHIAAGSGTASSVPEGACARIMTGAPLPDGTDAVIPFEDVEDRGDVILVRMPVELGACVRPVANDISAGQPILRAGTVLFAPQIALLASVGLAWVPVTRRPTVTILATGDELVPPGTQLKPGQIYNSNTPMLGAAISAAGATARVLPTASDDLESLQTAFYEAASGDLIVTSGGASVGDFDYVKKILEGEQLRFWRVRVRPGKPLIFGEVRGVPVVGLPGNPTSAMVTFELFARPAIRAMLGAPLFRSEVEAIADDDIDNRGGRRTYARVKLRIEDGIFHASLSGAQDSAMLLPLAQADGLLIVPEDQQHIARGSRARVQVWTLPSN